MILLHGGETALVGLMAILFGVFGVFVFLGATVLVIKLLTKHVKLKKSTDYYFRVSGIGCVALILLLIVGAIIWSAIQKM